MSFLKRRTATRQHTASRSAAGLRAATAVFVALFLFGVVYRVRIALTLGDTFASDLPTPLRALLRQGAADTMFALLCAGLTLILGQLGAGLSARRPARLVGLVLLGLILFEIGILCQGHHGTFFATGNGLTAQLLEESLSWLALKELILLLTPGETVFMFLPPLFFAAFLALPRRLRRPVRTGILASATLLVLFGCITPAAPLPDALLHHPVGFVAIDLLRSRRQPTLLPDAMAGNDRGLPSEAAMAMPPELDAPEEPLDKLPVGGAKELPVLALSSPLYLYPESERPGKKILPKLDGDVLSAGAAKPGAAPPFCSQARHAGLCRIPGMPSAGPGWPDNFLGKTRWLRDSGVAPSR